jgi:Ca-activated chloride channel family protein
MSKRVILPTAAGFAVAFLVASLPSRARQQDTLKVDIQLVNVVATVTDENGRYVEGLTVDDFIIEDEGVPQQIVHFTQDRDIPATVGIVIDASGSMERRIRTALRAVERFIGTLHEDDDVFIMTFSGAVSLIQDITSDREKLSRSLRRVHTVGGTALYDALSAGLDKVVAGRHDKRAVLLITDGDDTSRSLEFEETLEAVRKSEMLVYCLGIDPVRFADPSEHVDFDWPMPPVPGVRGLGSNIDDEPVDMEVLQSFGRASGGKAYLVSSTWRGGGPTEIDVVLDEVSAELRSQYTLGYYPSNVDQGGWHDINVRTRDESTVRARNGYFAP